MILFGLNTPISYSSFSGISVKCIMSALYAEQKEHAKLHAPVSLSINSTYILYLKTEFYYAFHEFYLLLVRRLESYSD